MRRRPIAAAGVLVLSMGLVWAGANPASAYEPDRARAVCDHRLCLLVLDESTDSDGDGVTDVDEQTFGTDPFDPASRPETREIVDVALARELPSFEEHLTELVALPKTVPDGTALATGLGAFALPEQGALVRSVGGLLRGLDVHGFTLGTDLTAMLARPPSANQSDRFTFAGRNSMALYAGGIVGPSNFGTNGSKAPAGITGGSPEFTYGANGQSVGHEYTVNYEDGSRDDVHSSAERTGNNTNSVTGVTSYDAEGNKSGFTSVTTSETKYSDGSRTTSVTTNTTSFDSAGNVTGSTSTTSSATTGTTNEDGSTTDEFFTSTTTYDGDGNQSGRTETSTVVTSSDGKVTTTTTETTYDADDNVVSSTETTTTTEDCAKTGCPDGGYADPDYVSMGPITGADLARVAARLNSTRTPGPDTGQIDFSEIPAPGKWPLVALINPDGVVSFAAGGQPSFNRAQPEYDPYLSELAGHAGVGAPQDNGNGGVSWPD